MFDPFVFTIDRSKDNAIYYVVPIIGLFYRWRLAAAASLLPANPLDRLIDVGYGSGRFLGLVRDRARRAFGVDHHAYHAAVRERALRRGHEVALVRGDLHALPFRSESFDAASCLSVLEHVADIRMAVRELSRILRPGGILVAGFPPRSRLTAACFHLIGFDYKRFHPNDEHVILSALREEFVVETVLVRPRRTPLFVLVRCRRAPGPRVGTSHA